MKMRFRQDGWHYADLKAYGWRFADHLGEEGEKVYGSWIKDQAVFDEYKAEWDAVPKAEPGDVWRIRWAKDFEDDNVTPWPEGKERPITGYAICCISCGRVHHWTSANNCSAEKRYYTYKDKDGNDVQASVCIHSGNSSCWQWTGSAEEGTLTGAPSLQVIAHNPGDCAWHGYIQDGDIHP